MKTGKSEFGLLSLAAGLLILGTVQPASAQNGNGIQVPAVSDAKQTLSRPAAVFNGDPGAISGNPFGGHFESTFDSRGNPQGIQWVSDCAQGGSAPSTSGMYQPTPDNTNYSDSAPSLFAQSPAGSQSGEAAVASGAYLDLAMPVTQFRFRFENATGTNFPDRGEYFYAKCGCFRDPQAGALQDPSAKGPAMPESNVDYQDYRSYFEFAFSRKSSIFVELPVRAINPTVNANTAGFADMNAGFKFALISNPYQFFTFQTRGYAPTGDADRGLGNGHPSVEFGFLYYQVLAERFILQGEVKDWIPINGNSGWQSNVVQFGGGLGYVAFDDDYTVITPQIEVVGWAFSGGQKSSTTLIDSADGDTIVNFKPGIRFGWKMPGDPIGAQRNSVYAGWAHPMTADRFYKNVFRLEYRVMY